jgi:ABC-2 type transport system ATP-binding protein
MDTVVEVRSASKAFGRTRALEDVSLVIDRGEVVALLGPNGAGKTTLISLLLGLRKPSSGAVSIFGLNPRDRRARSRTGVMLQESGLPMFLRVREIIELFRTFYPNPIECGAAIRLAGLDEKADSMIATLSGGQQQRLYFALAICGGPDALFLDEPTVGLDVESRRNFWLHLREFVRAGRTLLLTTHYLEEADALADRIIVIDKGHLVADAPPGVLKSRVQNKRLSFETPTMPDLDGLPVQRVEMDGNRVHLLTSEPEAVLRALFSRNAEVRNLEVVGATLEEAVMGLTGDAAHG